MTGVVAGVDVGGSKTHIRVVSTVDGVLSDTVVPSDGWSAVPADTAAAWLYELIRDVPLSALAVGAHGCETPADCEALRRHLFDRVNVPVTVVNDAQLLLPAAGLAQGIAVVAGTGSIALHDNGTITRAGGWGWVLGDDGSASAIVREAAKAVLAQADRGEPPSELAVNLMASVGVTGVLDLAQAMSWGSAPEQWGSHARAVFASSSADAREVIAAGAASLVDLVAVLAGRGLPVTDVVFAGGLVTQVPSYWQAVRSAFTARFPAARVQLLTVPPVEGAIRLATAIVQP